MRGAIDIQFDYKAQYYKLGRITSQTKQVWFVLHGYGQLAQYFIKKFQVLESANICVTAPEGLSKFYLENVESRNVGSDNRVGASWMTRENRETEIENYINYLQQIYDKELGTVVDIDITILGFSQGGATAARWAMSEKPKFNRFVLWAGIFPSDIDFEKGKEALKMREIITVYGKSDPFITKPGMKEMQELSARLNLKPEKLEFDGKHEINEELLIQIAKL